MPLLDHFHPPLSRSHPWRAFHGAWAAAMARLLNAGVLPPGYTAMPFLDRDGPFEIDVAAVREFGMAAEEAADSESAWSPSSPSYEIAIDWPIIDAISVEIRSDDGDPQLAAAIELVSPANKDRDSAREAFAAKCADHLRGGRGVVVVDAVTTRRADLHADLLAELGVGSAEPQGSLTAVSYRSIGREAAGRLQVWTAALKLGESLPTLPLWLGGELRVPLDLEASHSAACRDLNIRKAG